MSKELENGRVEFTDEEVDLVAGGKYSTEEWNAMSVEERQAAQRRSILAYRQGTACEMD